MTATPQLMLNRKWYQASKAKMEFHIINIIYSALAMRAQTLMTTFSCKDDCTLTKHKRCWTNHLWEYPVLNYNNCVSFTYFSLDLYDIVSDQTHVSNPTNLVRIKMCVNQSNWRYILSGSCFLHPLVYIYWIRMMKYETHIYCSLLELR